jgi:hypothetical protein
LASALRSRSSGDCGSRGSLRKWHRNNLRRVKRFAGVRS